MRITELFTAQSIALDEALTDQEQIISRLVELQATHGNITDKEAYKKALYAREAEGSTYVDNGITVPHAKTNVVTRPSLAALRLSSPVQYNAEDDGTTDLLFAIALPAIASALLFNVGASSGGTDVIALIVEKYTHIHNVAVALFLTDLFMVIAACFVFDLYTALYSFVGLTVKSLVIDAVLEKIKMCKAILIVCDDRKPICDFVMRKLMRGATYTPCFGAYTDKPHYIIYTTLTRREADQLQDFIHKQHLNAFMSMLSTTEVFGKGFNHA